MRTRRKSYTPPPRMEEVHELAADDYSDMESTDDSSDESDYDRVETDTALINDEILHPEVLNTEISSTESEFDGFTSGDNLFELPMHFDRGDDLARFIEGWRDGPRPRQNLRFTGRPGLDGLVLQDFPDNPTPLDYFQLFIQDCDFEEMATETNRYFDQCTKDKNLKPRARSRQWWDTNATEMKVFIATTMAMTLVVQRDITDYWSAHEVTQTPYIGKIMTRDRFWLLVTYLHLDNNENYPSMNSPGYTPLNKLGRLYNRVVQRFTRVYKPNKHISVVEGIVPWRGNLSFRVYNPDKPKKYGIKAFMLCDSENGYVCKFKLYTGKYEGKASPYGATFDVVMDLTKDYINRGYHVFMDNFYSSPLLYVNLWERGIGATGTLRPARKGTPKIMKQKRFKPKKQPGDMILKHNRNLLCVRYQDKKPVCLLSTIEDVELVETGKVNRENGAPIKKPRILDQYNKYMGGVDRADQMLSYTPFRMKTLKWWKRVWFHVINVALLNAYVVYKMRTEKPHMNSRSFRREVIGGIVERANPDDVPTMRKRAAGRPSSNVEHHLRLHGRHFPSKIVPLGKKSNISRACKVCSESKKEMQKRQAELDGEPVAKRKRYGRESSYECTDCHVPLCVAPCFRIYHTYTKYVQAYIRETTGPAENAANADNADNDEGEEED